MAKYHGTGTNGIINFVDAASEESASDLLDNLVSGNNKITNVGICLQCDFSLIDPNFETQYQILSLEGWTFYGTALNRKSFITKWKTARAANTGNFTNQTYFDCDEAPKAKFNFNSQKIIRMLNCHFGQSNSDYTLAQIDAVIAKAVQGQYTHIRDNYSTLDDTMAYATGSRLGGVNGSIAKAKTAGIGYSLILSISGGTGTLPATLLPSWTASLATSESFTKSEVLAVLNKFILRGRAAQTLNPDVEIWGVGSETENLDANIKIKSTNKGGVKEPPAPRFDDVKGMDIYTSNTEYNARAYPVAIAAIAGYDIGIKQINPNAKTYCNASFLHYGQIAFLMKEAKRLYGANINWFGQDAYNPEEYGSDVTGYFNNNGGSTSSRGQWIQKPYKYFVQSGICEGVGIAEIGWNTARSNPDGLTQTQWFDLVRTQYHADPRCLFICEYEALSEPVSRASSTDAAERTYGMSDTTLAAMATWQYNPKPPHINSFI